MSRAAARSKIATSRLAADPQALIERLEESFGFEILAKLLYAQLLIQDESGLGEVRITFVDGRPRDVNSTVYLER